MGKRARRSVYLDGPIEIAHTDVIRFAVGGSEDDIRSDVWTVFGSANKPDFYMTSSLISTDQKGSIHQRRAQFGYTSQVWALKDQNFQGERGRSRHLEVLAIPHLSEGDHFHVMTVRLPGIGLRLQGIRARRPKPLILFPPYGHDTSLTFNFVLYQGDWHDFIAPYPGQKAVAALQNEDGRSLIIFLRKEREIDARGAAEAMLRSLPSAPDLLRDKADLTLFVTHTRAADKPIVMTEMHNINVISTAEKRQERFGME